MTSPARVSLADVTPPIALGPLDGRYRSAVAPLVDHLSEAALNRERVHVEVEWLIHLASQHVVPGAPDLSAAERQYLRDVVASFGPDEVAELAEIERTTVHDVKAVEYFLKRRLADAPAVLGPDTVLPSVGELVHFACTSEDINNLSYALMVRGAVREVWAPAAAALVDEVAAMARESAATPMLALTHGQPATPTTLGKELAVLAHRLRRQLRRIDGDEFLGKLNGATGTYGAHVVAVPGADWPEVSRTFVEHLGLTWNPLTTQIESHDWQAELYADMARFNRVLHNLATDVWSYISRGVFIQTPVAGATGSSTMPHKVNPIRFENAEANLEMSCALLDTLAATLVTSRLQRDLTDSTTQRNIGPAFGHSLLAIDNVRRGLRALSVDAGLLARELDQNWEVLGEPVQSAMRAAAVAGVTGMQNPYERLKDLTRGRRLTAEDMRGFIAGLGLPDDVADRLAALEPGSYTGLAEQLVGYLDA
ncbi:adenylosuccinate lyase [Cellulomonas chengniuliangii]|uniref:Adenylosuccinate lyase n=1 Tax=Cellulomonas chengniuliangii TaxID=2968084 RepID=A0ABY5KZF9_9CELL|nr:adenylosuccinate lyase [Cellulomonas chengniuliangii]MCC2309217.1 adenylosuccinate lyase [Cellulomonas chengniuliangii]MCC2318561.1 adenylosuccinate lyase [Cellulomonas chengniuliangii]UUI75208.1 adenylosuccinate lyase [Cellulomonas chengniuliangii]